MNFKINYTIFSFETLLFGINLATLMEIYKKLIKTKEGFESTKQKLIKNTVAFGDNVEDVIGITIQLDVIEQNLKTMKTVLLIKEAEVFEHVCEFEHLDTHIFNLN